MTEKELNKVLGTKEILNMDLPTFRKKYCGKKLGAGCFRTVYEFKPAPDKYVLKIDKSDMLANIMEWKMWLVVAMLNGNYTPIRESFAKCFGLIFKANYSILVQERADMSRPKKDYPKKTFHFMSDFKYPNFGFIGDRFVCVDYGGVLEISASQHLTLKTKTVKRWRRY